MLGSAERKILTSMDQAVWPTSESTDNSGSVIEFGGAGLLLHSFQTPGVSPRVSLLKSPDTPLNPL